MFEYLYSICLIIILISTAVLATLVLLKNPRSIFNQTFFLMVISTFVYALAFFVRYTVIPIPLISTKEAALLWAKIASLAAVPLFSALSYFLIIFPDRINKPIKGFRFVLFYCLVPAIMVILVAKGLVIKDMQLVNNKYFVVPGHYHPLYALFLFGNIGYGLYVALAKYRTQSDMHRLQLKFVTLGLGISVMLGLLTNLLQPMLILFFPEMKNLSPMNMLGPLFIMIYLVLTFYAMIKHRMLDAEILISRTLGFLFALIIVVVLYTTAFAASEEIFKGVAGYNSFVVTAVAALIIAFVFHPLQGKIQFLIFTKYFAKNLDYQKSLLNESQQLVTKLNREELISYFLETIRSRLEIDNVAFFLKKADEDAEIINYYLHSHRGLDQNIANRFEMSRGMVDWFNEEHDVFIRDEAEQILSSIRFLKIYEPFEQIGAEMIIPIFIKERLEGILALGCKGSGRVYSKADINILNILSAHFGIALENTRLYGEAISDELTGLFNFRYLQHRLNEELSRAYRYKRMITLLMIDLDHFKQINDDFGHLAGDYVLKEIARIVQSTLSEGDAVCRYGGDEFCVIIPDIDKKIAAFDNTVYSELDLNLLPAYRIIDSVRNSPFVFSGRKIPVTVSIGVSYTGPDIPNDMDGASFIKAADQALYLVKEAGRNQAQAVKFVSPQV